MKSNNAETPTKVAKILSQQTMLIPRSRLLSFAPQSIITMKNPIQQQQQ